MGAEGVSAPQNCSRDLGVQVGTRQQPPPTSPALTPPLPPELGMAWLCQGRGGGHRPHCTLMGDGGVRSAGTGHGQCQAGGAQPHSMGGLGTPLSPGGNRGRGMEGWMDRLMEGWRQRHLWSPPGPGGWRDGGRGMSPPRLQEDVGGRWDGQDPSRPRGRALQTAPGSGERTEAISSVVIKQIGVCGGSGAGWALGACACVCMRVQACACRGVCVCLKWVSSPRVCPCVRGVLLCEPPPRCVGSLRVCTSVCACTRCLRAPTHACGC